MRLPKIKRRIVTAMLRNGECDGNWLHRYVYGERAERTRRNVLKAHIWQLRKLGFRIVGTSRGRHPSRYILEAAE